MIRTMIKMRTTVPIPMYKIASERWRPDRCECHAVYVFDSVAASRAASHTRTAGHAKHDVARDGRAYAVRRMTLSCRTGAISSAYK